MKLQVHLWEHSNLQLVYSYFYYCIKHNIKVDIEINKSVHYNGALIYNQKKTFFFDYSDDTVFIDSPSKYDFYFKRSLLLKDKSQNVFPLNFNLPLAYNSISFLSKLKFEFLKDKPSRIEFIRAIDIFDLFTNNSHSAMDVKKYSYKIEDKGGNVIYHTRLWNPNKAINEQERERRLLQNDFRINACRIIKKNFKNSSVGLFPDELSLKLGPDVLLDLKQTDKKTYLKKMRGYNIGIADDGLKDTPGWKIGEYLLNGKAVITTPLNVCIDNFYENKNYLKLTDRSAYKELPDKIEMLLQDKKYLEMASDNLKWSREYIHPFNYIERIFATVRNEN